MKATIDYINQNKERFLDELFDLLRIPSISAQPSLHKQDMVRCAEWLAAALVKAGADRAEVMPTEGNPVVYAEKIIDPKAKTVLGWNPQKTSYEELVRIMAEHDRKLAKRERALREAN